MIRPVTAMTTFFPTDESHNSHSRFIRRLRSRVYYRLSRTHRLGRLTELLAFGVGEGHLDDALEAASPQFAGNSTKHIAETELTLKPGRAGKYAFLVQGNRLDHLHRSGTRGIVRRAGLEKTHDFRAAVASTVDDSVELLLVYELGDRDARDRGVRDQRHHGVPVSAEHHGLDVFDGNIQSLGQKGAVPGCV